MIVNINRDVGIYAIQPDRNLGDRSIIGFRDQWRLLIDFTIPDGVGDIKSITLYLYEYTISYAYDNRIDLHKLYGTFIEEQATWNNRTLSELWTNPGAEGDYDPTIIDHYDASGATPGWHMWTIKGVDADNSLDTLTWGDTSSFILIAHNIEVWRRDEYNTKDAEMNQPYVEVLLEGECPSPIASFIHTGESCI